MKLLATAFLLLSYNAAATVTVGADLCPQEFTGKVVEVVKALGPETAFSTQKVIFETHQTVRGEVSDKVPVDILVNGPFDIQSGKEYRVLLRKGKLCWIEAL